MIRYAAEAMSNVVNLGRARKRKREEANRRRADENAIRHGRTKAEKARERMEQAKLRATVDGARLAPVPAQPDASAADDAAPARPTAEPADDEP